MSGSGAYTDERESRLRTERLELQQLNRDSDHVSVQPINPLPGSEPEWYHVVMLCRGIAGIDGDGNPVYADRHEVQIHCDERFPEEPPRLKWLTPIWHPNVQHDDQKAVCINKPEWLGGMGLVDLCRQLFEMAQYKNYHAEHTQPYPLDPQVAEWVRGHAEPQGIVDKSRGLSVDDKPFTRPLEGGTGPGSAIKVLSTDRSGTITVKSASPGSDARRDQPRIRLLSDG